MTRKPHNPRVTRETLDLGPREWTIVAPVIATGRRSQVIA